MTISQIQLAWNDVSTSSYSGVSLRIIKSGHILIVITFSTFNLWNVSKFTIIVLVEHAVYLAIITAFIQMSSCNFDPINDCNIMFQRTHLFEVSDNIFISNSGQEKLSVSTKLSKQNIFHQHIWSVKVNSMQPMSMLGSLKG